MLLNPSLIRLNKGIRQRGRKKVLRINSILCENFVSSIHPLLNLDFNNLNRREELLEAGMTNSSSLGLNVIISNSYVLRKYLSVTLCSFLFSFYA